MKSSDKHTQRRSDAWSIGNGKIQIFPFATERFRSRLTSVWCLSIVRWCVVVRRARRYPAEHQYKRSQRRDEYAPSSFSLKFNNHLNVKLASKQWNGNGLHLESYRKRKSNEFKLTMITCLFSLWWPKISTLYRRTRWLDFHLIGFRIRSVLCFSFLALSAFHKVVFASINLYQKATRSKQSARTCDCITLNQLCMAYYKLISQAHMNN